METISQEELDNIEYLIKEGSKEDLSRLRETLLKKFKKIDVRIKLSEQRFGRMYIRSIKVPAGMLLLGKTRNTANSWICMYGEMITRKSDEDHAITTKTGHTTAGLDEPHTWRIAVTKTECKWSTIHRIPKWVPIGKELDYISGNLKELVKA